MIKLYKILFTTTLILSTLIVVSSQTWLGMWIGLEINLLSIIPLMNSSKNMMCTEASIKYFITQALASTILLFSIILMSTFFLNLPQEKTTLMLNSALFTKMGAAPFHFWFPEVIEGLNWMNSLILMTWQKIAPMTMIMYNINFVYFNFIIVCCMLISGIMGINQISLRKILAYSSINHIGWMIGALMFMETSWMIYFVIYSIISINIVLIFNKLNLYYLKQLFCSMTDNMIMKILFVFNFMSLAGLPPFLGFFPKWITIQTMVMNNSIMMPLLMIVLTLITMFFYLRITFSTILLSANEINFITMPKQKIYSILMFNMISILSLVYCTMIFNLN
uniref:NADH-ubiquinone oxidoreductase chain 2 n=1 Tax=Tropisternus sp. BYU-CO166 TaxID=696091 RepID=D8WKH2_9COLE|nr:NADH dehydrogenase subunit 2 [Tropisternus sp. BYU-CO166]ACZ58505.1 NADH dehydrogenase subunit 2 [Tropisternus sp. BYU-CO166]